MLILPMQYVMDNSAEFVASMLAEEFEISHEQNAGLISLTLASWDPTEALPILSRFFWNWRMEPTKGAALTLQSLYLHEWSSKERLHCWSCGITVPSFTFVQGLRPLHSPYALGDSGHQKCVIFAVKAVLEFHYHCRRG